MKEKGEAKSDGEVCVLNQSTRVCVYESEAEVNFELHQIETN